MRPIMRSTMRLGRSVPLLVLAVFLLAGCETPAPRRFPEITFQHLPKIRIDVARIEYAPRYQPPVAPPNIGHEFPVPPAAAAERWIADRLVAVGKRGVATVTIEQATATEKRLSVTKGIKGAFTTDQAWRYNVRVAMSIKAIDPDRQRTATARAEARVSRTMPEDASLADREAVWFALTEKAMKRLNRVFESEIRKDLAAFVK